MKKQIAAAILTLSSSAVLAETWTAKDAHEAIKIEALTGTKAYPDEKPGDWILYATPLFEDMAAIEWATFSVHGWSAELAKGYRNRNRVFCDNTARALKEHNGRTFSCAPK